MDSGSAFHVGGAGNYVLATGEGTVNLSGTINLAGGNDTWNGEIALAGTARVGSYGGGVITKTFTGPISGTGTFNLWAGGGGNTHENVYVLSGASTVISLK